jgi:hypothetical protein
MAKSNIRTRTSRSTSSTPTVDSKRYEAILELGKRLVRELSIENTNDTLGRWLAHDLAELIEVFESASPGEKGKERGECIDAILRIWAHRNELPSGHRPLESFTSIYQTLQALDYSDPTPRYFRAARQRAKADNKDSGPQAWLDCATSLDDGARILIRYCLVRAAETALNQESDWVKLAHDLTNVSDDDLRIVIVLAKQARLLDENDPNAVERAELQKMIAKLERLQTLAMEVKADLSRKLSGVPPPRKGKKAS